MSNFLALTILVPFLLSSCGESTSTIPNVATAKPPEEGQEPPKEKTTYTTEPTSNNGLTALQQASTDQFYKEISNRTKEALKEFS